MLIKIKESDVNYAAVKANVPSATPIAQVTDGTGINSLIFNWSGLDIQWVCTAGFPGTLATDFPKSFIGAFGGE